MIHSTPTSLLQLALRRGEVPYHPCEDRDREADGWAWFRPGYALPPEGENPYSQQQGFWVARVPIRVAVDYGFLPVSNLLGLRPWWHLGAQVRRIDPTPEQAARGGAPFWALTCGDFLGGTWSCGPEPPVSGPPYVGIEVATYDCWQALGREPLRLF